MMDDLFGHVPQQSELFGASVQPEPRSSGPIVHTPDTIRARMLRLIGEARAASRVPWSKRELQSHTALFPYMAEWLPKAEGEQLLLEFRAEIERLTDRPTPRPAS